MGWASARRQNSPSLAFASLHFSRFCDFQLQLNVVVPKRIELQNSSCAHMKEREFLFPNITNKIKIGLWAGHQRAGKTPPFLRSRVCIFPVFAIFNFNLM